MTRTGAQWRSARLEFFDKVTQEVVQPIAPILFEEEWLGAWTAVPPAGTPESGCRWVDKIVGAGPPTVGILANGDGGQVECALNVSGNKQSADVYMDDNRQFSIEYDTMIEMWVNMAVIPDDEAELNWGLFGDWADGYDAITYSAFFTLDGTAEVICELDDNATNSSATSGITVVAGVWHCYKIDFTDVTSVKFYIDGAQVAAATTFPYAATGANAVLQPFVGAYKAAGAGLGTVNCRSVRIWGNRS